MRFLVLLTCLFSFNTVLANHFDKCEDEATFLELKSSQCIKVKAPLVYQDKSDKVIDIFVRKFPSLESRSGVIWLIAGGPGESGASFYSMIETYRKSFPHFDILVPDHRGTGASSTICPEESIDSVGGKTLVGEEWGSCFSHMYSNLDYVNAFTITNAAKDLRQLINTMSGKGQRYVYGVSYGTQLVLRLMQLDDINLDGIILDSLVPMQDDLEFDLSQRSLVVDRVGKTLLSKCRLMSSCNGKTGDELIAQLATLSSTTKSIKAFAQDLPDIPLSSVLGTLLDIPAVRMEIPNIIHSLANGDSKLLESAIKTANSYYEKFNPGYSNFGSSIPLVQIITASENNLRPQLTKAEVAKESENLLFTSPLPGLMAENRMPTYHKDAHYAALPEKLPKTLILHGTLDPKTHYEGAKKHAAKLNELGEVSFIEVLDAPHFIALNAPVCFKTSVESFIAGSAIAQPACRDPQVSID